MIAIIDYGAGNLTSVARALAHIGVKCSITDRYEDILSSEKIIFPGVGAAGKAMETIKAREIDRAIYDVIAQRKPFLGICMGAQIILGRSEENDTACLGIIPGSVKRFPDGDLKIPHMGWNNISFVRKHPVFEGLDEKAQFYFVHSYYLAPEQDGDIVATTDYGISFASVIGHDTVVATQFHPEKSGRHGLQILKNFCDWDGRV